MVYPTIKLGEVASVVTKGTTPTTVGYQFVEDGIPFLRAEDVNGGIVNFDTVEKRITSECHRNLARSQLATNDLLITIAGTVGRVGLVPNVALAANCNQAVCLVRLKPGHFDLEFLAYSIRSESVQGQFRTQGTTATITNVSLAQIRDLALPCPPIDEQRRIVDILSRAEGIVRLRREGQKKAADIIPALFLDMFGDPATNPRGWPAAPIGELCDLVRGSSPRPQGDLRFFAGPVPRLMIADITRDGTFVRPQIDSLTVEGATKSRPMKAGDVVMAVSGAVGLPAILAIDACIHDGFVGFRELQEWRVLPLFLYNFLQTLRRRATHEAVGAIFQDLTTHQIKRWEVPLPPLTHQVAFAQRVEAVVAVHCQQSSATAKAEATFDSLLARVFSPASLRNAAA